MGSYFAVLSLNHIFNLWGVPCTSKWKVPEGFNIVPILRITVCDKISNTGFVESFWRIGEFLFNIEDAMDAFFCVAIFYTFANSFFLVKRWLTSSFFCVAVCSCKHPCKTTLWLKTLSAAAKVPNNLANFYLISVGYISLLCLYCICFSTYSFKLRYILCASLSICIVFICRC